MLGEPLIGKHKCHKLPGRPDPTNADFQRFGTRRHKRDQDQSERTQTQLIDVCHRHHPNKSPRFRGLLVEMIPEFQRPGR